MAIIDRAEFVNKFELHTKFTTDTKLASYIDRYEVNYLVELLGVELYNLFIADIENPIYDILLTEILFQDGCEIYNSKGIKDMLLGFIYFEFQRDAGKVETINSSVKIKSNVSDRASFGIRNLQSWYNESVATYKAIQAYLKLHSDVYPTFKGVDTSYIMPFS